VSLDGLVIVQLLAAAAAAAADSSARFAAFASSTCKQCASAILCTAYAKLKHLNRPVIPAQRRGQGRHPRCAAAVAAAWAGCWAEAGRLLQLRARLPHAAVAIQAVRLRSSAARTSFSTCPMHSQVNLLREPVAATCKKYVCSPSVSVLCCWASLWPTASASCFSRAAATGHRAAVCAGRASMPSSKLLRRLARAAPVARCGSSRILHGQARWILCMPYARACCGRHLGICGASMFASVLCSLKDGMKQAPLRCLGLQSSGGCPALSRLLPLVKRRAQQLRLRVDVELRLVQHQRVRAQLQGAAHCHLAPLQRPARGCRVANVGLERPAQCVLCSDWNQAVVL